MTIIGISAENGGIDAHQAMIPHLKALKDASRDISFNGLAFPKLAFIFRVDGSVTTYGLPGPGNLDFDRRHQWVSVDIVIPNDEWKNRNVTDVAEFISKSIVSSVAVLRQKGGKLLSETDWDALVSALHQFCNLYRDELANASGAVKT